MDELLRYPHTAPAPAPVKTRRAARQKVPALALPRVKGFQLPNLLERRSPLDPAIFLTVALSLAAASVLGGLYCPTYALSVDGQAVGLVSSPQSVADAVDRVEARAGSILGREYTLNHDIAFTFQVARREELTPISRVETYLFDQIGEVMKTSVLSVNGRMIGAADDDAALNAMLDAVKAPYVNANTISAEFVEPVVVTREYTATSALRSIESMRSVLTANSMERVDYAVQPGDTFSGIANSHDMRMSQLQLLNPDVDIDCLQIGQVLTISQAVPYVSVKTVDHLIYDGAVPFQVEEVPDDSLYQGDTKVIVPGVEGLATYTADVSYLNGVEDSRTILNTDVHVEPITQVVAVGTKERPRTMATGHFQWPLYGRINSTYGSRYIFGSYSFHTGLDIAGSYGAPIAAADGGRVTFAGRGTGSYWSYGNYVVIDHENGLKTIYAHCSSVNVRAGDRVYKGQTVARVGATGRATGNHCHFQVKFNGETVNPYNYLP